MKINGIYSFSHGESYIKEHFQNEFDEILNAISMVDAEKARTKISKEKTMIDKLLYSPVDLNKQFKRLLNPQGWSNKKEYCEYPKEFFVDGYKPSKKGQRPFRDMDFVKNKLGVEVQFGKYSFMVYNVAAKMTIFRNLGHIKAGIEIVPVKELAEEMSTGVSYFEQFVWDLEKRGHADIDIPVMILGINK